MAEREDQIRSSGPSLRRTHHSRILDSPGPGPIASQQKPSFSGAREVPMRERRSSYSYFETPYEASGEEFDEASGNEVFLERIDRLLGTFNSGIPVPSAVHLGTDRRQDTFNSVDTPVLRNAEKRTHRISTQQLAFDKVSPTISRDNTHGDGVRKSRLLAEWGKRIRRFTGGGAKMRAQYDEDLDAHPPSSYEAPPAQPRDKAQKPKISGQKHKPPFIGMRNSILGRVAAAEKDAENEDDQVQIASTLEAYDALMNQAKPARADSEPKHNKNVAHHSGVRSPVTLGEPLLTTWKGYPPGSFPLSDNPFNQPDERELSPNFEQQYTVEGPPLNKNESTWLDFDAPVNTQQSEFVPNKRPQQQGAPSQLMGNGPIATHVMGAHRANTLLLKNGIDPESLTTTKYWEFVSQSPGAQKKSIRTYTRLQKQSNNRPAPRNGTTKPGWSSSTVDYSGGDWGDEWY